MWALAAELGGPQVLAAVTSCMGFSRSFWERDDSRSVQETFVRALEAGGMQRFLRDLDSTLRIDLDGKLQAIRADTLLIGADEDVIAPIHAARSGIGLAQIHEQLGSSRLVTIEGCGHFVALERADALADLILEWMAKAT
jgi:pimeloyl-ACP methyl ester carboxylesterase